MKHGHRRYSTAAWIYRGLLISMISAALVSSCAPWRRPAGPYSRIDQEPSLSVFIHDSREVRPMPLEGYLAGVVAGEMDPDWPLEALKSQAILARTFTIEALQRRGGTRDITGTDVSTDETQFQAYDATKINDNVRRAVAETRGQIMVNARGEPVRAWYHADAGGRTATPLEGLNFRDAPTPQLRVVSAASANPEAEWSETFTTDEILAAARRVAPDANIAGITSIRIASRGPSGRATQIAIGNQRLSAPELRLALDPRRMRSTLLTELRLAGDAVIMAGRGFGHGVGLPQWSARYHAERGEQATAILTRFYRGVRVERWWE